jgi:hypothetical protein
MRKKKQHTHWVWEQNPYDKRWAEVRGTSGFDRDVSLAILGGEPVPAPLPTLRITEVTPGLHPDLLLHPTYMIASDRLAKVLLDAGAHVQLFPVRLMRLRAKYHVVNALDHVQALDEAQSKVRRWPSGNMRSVQKLVLRPLPAGTPPLFRVATLPLFYVVSDELRRSIEEICDGGAGRFIAIDKFKYA